MYGCMRNKNYYKRHHQPFETNDSYVFWVNGTIDMLKFHLPYIIPNNCDLGHVEMKAHAAPMSVMLALVLYYIMLMHACMFKN